MNFTGSTHLPAELWLQIFETLDNATESDYSCRHRWFQPRYDVLLDQCRGLRQIHVAIALVCKAWHTLITPRLYRHVVLGLKFTNVYPEHVVGMWIFRTVKPMAS
jgi:hypothetical protein